MSWEDLTKDNIEEVKTMYMEYLEDNREYNYRANLMTFEEFIEKELTKCERCETPIYKGNEYCECCHDDLFEV